MPYGSPSAPLQAPQPVRTAEQNANIAGNVAMAFANGGKRAGTNSAAASASASQTGLFHTPGTPANSFGAKWDTTLDSQVGAIDQQIKAAQGYQGTESFNAEQLQQLQTQRQQLNTQRWASAGLAGHATSPGAQRVQQLLASGALSYQDLGSIDISLLNDDQALAQAIDDLMRAKAAPPPTAPVETPGTKDNVNVETAGKGAQDAVTNVLGQVNTFANSALDPKNPDSALGKFDALAGQQFDKISSAATSNARNLGVAGASAQANHYGTNLQGNLNEQRGEVQKNTMSDVQDFINKAVSGAETQQLDVTNMDTTKRLNLQAQGLQGIQGEIKKAIASGQMKADAQTQELMSAIDAYNTKLKAGEEDTAEHNRIIGLIAGVAMAGLGATAAATGFGAPAAPFLIGAGGGMIARNA